MGGLAVVVATIGIVFIVFVSLTPTLISAKTATPVILAAPSTSIPAVASATTVAIRPTIKPSLTPVAGSILFNHDFNQGNLDGWAVLRGKWVISNGALVRRRECNVPGYDDEIFAGLDSWTDYEVQFDMERINGWDAGALFLRFSTDGFYSLGFHPTGWQYPSGVTLEKTGASIAGSNFPFQPNQWYHIKARIEGQNIKVWVVDQTGDTLLLNYTDMQALTHGKMALSTWAGAICPTEVRYDNIVIRNIP